MFKALLLRESDGKVKPSENWSKSLSISRRIDCQIAGDEGVSVLPTVTDFAMGFS